MAETLDALLTELEEFGRSNDKAAADRAAKMLNITRETGEFLAVLMHALQARRVLEIGTSNGYSTLWLADAARELGGHVTTVEQSDSKANMAQVNFARAQLAPYVTVLRDDAAHVLQQAAEDGFDLVFLDADRATYAGYWPQLRTLLRRGAMLVVDNAISHAADLADFMDIVRRDPAFKSSLVPVGNGEFLAVRVGDLVEP